MAFDIYAASISSSIKVLSLTIYWRIYVYRSVVGETWMKKIVVDIDETLLKSRKICLFLRYLAKILFKLSLTLQKPDLHLISKLRSYDMIIILTARGENYRNFTEKQLKKYGIRYHKLIMCDYSNLLFSWKSRKVSEISPDAWVDDLKSRYVGVEGYQKE